MYSRDGDEVWDVPVVVYCVLTVVLMISSFILLSCLKRETKKFRKKIANPDKVKNYVGAIVCPISLVTFHTVSFNLNMNMTSSTTAYPSRLHTLA